MVVIKKENNGNIIMEYIFIHGLGQNSSSWNETISNIKNNKKISCPELFSLFKEKDKNYDNLYSSFVEYCNNINNKLNLCGLSLGGILALNYAIDFPDKIESLVLIGTQYKIPKIIFNIQTSIFKLLPNSLFKNFGLHKKDVIQLANSMKNIDFSNKLEKIKCPVLIICGSKDNLNIKSAKYLYKNIENAKLKIIENTGHVVNEKNPKILASELELFYTP